MREADASNAAHPKVPGRRTSRAAVGRTGRRGSRRRLRPATRPLALRKRRKRQFFLFTVDQDLRFHQNKQCLLILDHRTRGIESFE